MEILYRLANFYISYFHELTVLKDSAYKIICDEKRRNTRTFKKQNRYKGVNSSTSEKSCEELLESIFCILSLTEEVGSAAHEY